MSLKPLHVEINAWKPTRANQCVQAQSSEPTRVKNSSISYSVYLPKNLLCLDVIYDYITQQIVIIIIVIS